MRASKSLPRLLLSIGLWLFAMQADAGGRLVVVMDDLGNQRASGLDALTLPWVSTYAIMPGRPFSGELAERAHQLGKEVIIHAPMANMIDFPLGPMGLQSEMTAADIRLTLQSARASVPYAVGLSNHMGSRLTQDREAMATVMRELKRQGLFFFDSRTVATTVAWQIAEQHQVPWSMRDIFLDHEPTAAFIRRQWQTAMQRVNAGETVVVICHPYAETLAFFRSLGEPDPGRIQLSRLSAVVTTYPVLVQERRNEPSVAFF